MKNMLIYIIILSAIVVITYLVQFLAYSHSRHTDLGTDILEMIGLPLENEFEYEQAVKTI
jgi:hypothetical protein